MRHCSNFHNHLARTFAINWAVPPFPALAKHTKKLSCSFPCELHCYCSTSHRAHSPFLFPSPLFSFLWLFFCFLFFSFLFFFFFFFHFHFSSFLFANERAVCECNVANVTLITRPSPDKGLDLFGDYRIDQCIPSGSPSGNSNSTKEKEQKQLRDGVEDPCVNTTVGFTGNCYNNILTFNHSPCPAFLDVSSEDDVGLLTNCSCPEDTPCQLLSGDKVICTAAIGDKCIQRISTDCRAYNSTLYIACVENGDGDDGSVVVLVFREPRASGTRVKKNFKTGKLKI